jgi:hypothetical protein
MSLIRRLVEIVGTDVAILLWEPLNNRFKELK